MRFLRRSLCWKTVVTFALTMTILGKLLSVAQIEGAEYLTQLVSLSSAILIVKMAVDLPVVFEYMSSRLKMTGGWRQRITNLIPEKMLSFIKLESAYQRGFFCWISRRKRADRSLGQIFSHHKTSAYAKFFRLAILVFIIEAPFSGLIIDVLAGSSHHEIIFNTATIFSSFYVLAWLISDRHLLKSSFHTVTREKLTIRIGIRFFADVFTTCIEEIGEIDPKKKIFEKQSHWLSRMGFSDSSIVIATPIDRPNVFVKITESSFANVEIFKIKKEGVKTILLYVDQPKKFVESVRSKMT